MHEIKCKLCDSEYVSPFPSTVCQLCQKSGGVTIDDDSITQTIRGELPDLNTVINLSKKHYQCYAKLKKQVEFDIIRQLKPQVIENYPVMIEFTWYTKNLRKDSDNVVFAKKYILDALVNKGILINDSRKYVVGFTDVLLVDKNDERVEVKIIGREVLR